MLSTASLPSCTTRWHAKLCGVHIHSLQIMQRWSCTKAKDFLWKNVHISPGVQAGLYAHTCGGKLRKNPLVVPSCKVDAEMAVCASYLSNAMELVWYLWAQEHLAPFTWSFNYFNNILPFFQAFSMSFRIGDILWFIYLNFVHSYFNVQVLKLRKSCHWKLNVRLFLLQEASISSEFQIILWIG